MFLGTTEARVCGTHGSRSPGKEPPHKRISADHHKPLVAFLNAHSQGKQNQELEVVPGRFRLARAPRHLRSDTGVPSWERGSLVWKPGCLQSQRSRRRGLGCCCRQPALAKTESAPIPDWFQSGSNTAITRIQRESKRAANMKHVANAWASQTVIKKSVSLTAINTPRSVFTGRKAATPCFVKPVLQCCDTSPPDTSLGGT